MVENKIKNGRTVPIKIEVYQGSTEYDGSSGNAPTISVSGVACGGASVVEAASEYADAGASTANTNGFRWSDDTPGLWIYNLDTKGLGLTTGACYRIDTSLGSQISTQAWLVVQVTK